MLCVTFDILVSRITNDLHIMISKKDETMIISCVFITRLVATGDNQRSNKYSQVREQREKVVAMKHDFNSTSKFSSKYRNCGDAGTGVEFNRVKVKNKRINVEINERQQIMGKIIDSNWICVPRKIFKYQQKRIKICNEKKNSSKMYPLARVQRHALNSTRLIKENNLSQLIRNFCVIFPALLINSARDKVTIYTTRNRGNRRENIIEKCQNRYIKLYLNAMNSVL